MSLPHFIPRLLILTPALSLFLVLTARVATSSPFQTGSDHRTITASSSNLAFGNIPLGGSLTQFETLTNTGNSTVTISQATVTGPGFGVRGLTLPVTLGKGQSVTFRVLCTPAASGRMTGSIAVISSTTPALAIALSGTGVPAGQLTSSAGALDFGSVAVGASKSMTATFTATGSSVTVSSATSTSAEFSLSGVSLPKTIAAGQSVTLTVTFKPQSTGTASGSISLGNNSAYPSVVETLTGSGTATAPHAVSLRWSPSASAVVGYNVYRSSTSAGPYTKINPVLNASTTYVDNSVQGGRSYYYVSTAINTNGVESKYSNQMLAVIPGP
ncbi:MAG: choice-of-anchor D domain-containing protein [Candidatus Angelobacter sp.]